MKRKKGLIRPWLFIGLIILVVFSLSGIGLAVAYKNGKFAQAQNPNPSASPTSVVTAADRTIIKTVSPTDLNQGDPFNITLDIPGKKDASTEVHPAEIMFVIDTSQSMDRSASPNQCYMYVDNDPHKARIRPHAQRLCYAKTAAVHLMEMAASRNLPLKVGYQLFSSYDATYANVLSNGFIRFEGLTNMNNNSTRAFLEANLMGPCADENCQMQFGTAMGLGIEKAANELKNHGDPNANKYIILLSDGTEVLSYDMTNMCYPGSWPLDWPGNWSGHSFPPLCSPHTYDFYCKSYRNVQDPNQRVITPDLIYGLPWFGDPTHYVNDFNDFCQSDGRSPCAVSCAEIQSGRSDLFTHLRQISYIPYYPMSPASFAQENGIKVMTVGYYGGGSNTNAPFMAEIARHLYPQNNPGSIDGYYPAEADSGFLYQIMEDILNTVSNQNAGAKFTMVETLPPGAHAGNVSIWLNGTTNLNLAPTLGHDAQGRQTITYNISAGNYSSQTDPDSQTFQVRIQNIQYSCAGAFDPDQNYDSSGNPLDPMPSYVTWTFVNNGQAPITQYMPHRRIDCSTQYSGDVYAAGINGVMLKGIDVSATEQQNFSIFNVWSLSNYNFSDTSYSDYRTWREHMNQVVTDLKKRARTLNNLDQLFTHPNPNPDTNPEGGVWQTNGSLTIGGIHSIGRQPNQRATVIVNGNLNITGGTNIFKLQNSTNNILFIVLGNVNMTVGTIKIENVAIIDPYYTIKFEKATSVDFKGILAAGYIDMADVMQNYDTMQKIHYDTSLALYPPPGLSSIDLPIFKEVKP